MPVVHVLVALIVFCLVLWAVTRILAGFAIPDPIATVVYVLVVVTAVLWLLAVDGWLPMPGLRLR